MSVQLDATITEFRQGMGRIRGRLFEVVEAAGLPEKQEEALKRVIRRTTYDAQTDVESVLREGI